MKFTSILTIVLLQTCGVVVQASKSPPLAFQSFFQRPKSQKSTQTTGAIDLENQLLEALDNQDRLSNSDQIASLVTQLEECGQGLPQPAIAPEVYGRWRLMQTTNADTASPIQRKAVDTSKFPIYQDITVNEETQNLIVSQVVKFSDTNELKVDALASTSSYPLEELSEREGTGKIMGLNILGVSLVGEEAKPDPTRPDSRINFVFDEGNFDFGGLKVPYPVPFRLPLFRDAVKGWIDITYLSNRIRISRGNKGTTFVLVKEDEQATTSE
mmetsp:Transcript_23423/g.32837  ORF Transcript_23423/g.32837 Transcript_23423/m.32837 type:complete len:270 (-) Transcript_23423:30-839(-)